MSRVAIVGSCITRDLWPVQEGAPDDLLYVSRTSLPSLFSPPARGFQARSEPPEPLKRHQHRAVVADLTKQGLAALVAHRPTHVIFDFIDERFDLLWVEGSVVTHSWELEVSGYLEQPALSRAQPITRLSNACEELWRDALEELADFLRSTPLRDARLILHEARWADCWRDADDVRRPFEATEILPGRPADIAAHNRLLATYQDAFCAALPEVARVAASDRLADPDHRWGLSPFHYTPDYYRDIWSQLHALGV